MVERPTIEDIMLGNIGGEKMMLFALLKKDFLIVKKYVLIMLVVIALIPPVMRWRTPEFTGVFGFILSVIFGIFILLQYVSLKEYQFPKAATLLCATPFSRKAIVSSKYIFCMAIYAICCIVFELETLFLPGLGTSVYKAVCIYVSYSICFYRYLFANTV